MNRISFHSLVDPYCAPTPDNPTTTTTYVRLTSIDLVGPGLLSNVPCSLTGGGHLHHLTCVGDTTTCELFIQQHFYVGNTLDQICALLPCNLPPVDCS